jgi:RNA polymerase sigma-70 factor (ECF subfamily)
VVPRVRQLLERLQAGDNSALNELVAALYDELHRIAARRLRDERTGHTLQTTALVHEAYLKLVGERQRHYSDQVHFLAVAARVMRQVLVDYARARSTKKRAGDGDAISPGLEWTAQVEVAGRGGLEHIELLALDRALEKLALEDQSLAELVVMRYFGGMTAEETAAALNLSVHVVRHDLRLAQAWLRRNLSR